jgi:hypothetical protein
MSFMVLAINGTILFGLYICVALYVHALVVETWSPGHVLRNCKSLISWDCLGTVHRVGRDIGVPCLPVILRSMIRAGKL